MGGNGSDIDDFNDAAEIAAAEAAHKSYVEAAAQYVKLIDEARAHALEELERHQEIVELLTQIRDAVRGHTEEP
jgi:flagellar motor component MotA